MKRLLDVYSLPDVVPSKVDADRFTSFMEELQSSTPDRTVIYPTTFSLPTDFRTHVLKSIKTAKRKKAPGPDKVRTEVFSVVPDLFADALSELWAAVGRTAHIPPILTCATLRPVYKSGDPIMPSNYRPIVLTTSFRRIISASLNRILDESKPFIHRNQWGFRRSSNTECAIAYATQNMRAGKNIVALLDLQKANDRVPRNMLMDMSNNTVNENMSCQIRPLLYPMCLKTIGQI